MANETNLSITLYKNSVSANVVDKTSYLIGFETIGSCKDILDPIHPELTISLPSTFNYNYLKIRWSLNTKYYFIDSVTYVRDDLYNIKCTLDVLMTYKDGIKDLTAFVERNEFTYNTDYIDKKILINEGVNVEVLETSNDIFDLDDANYLSDFIYVLNGYKLGVTL